MTNLSSRVRLCLFEKTTPSEMREMSGTAKTASLTPVTRIETTWKEWPMMYSPLELFSDSLWRHLTAGIFLPSLGILMPSPTQMR